MEPLLEYIEIVSLLKQAALGVKVLVTCASGVQVIVSDMGKGVCRYHFHHPADQIDAFLDYESAINVLKGKGLRSWQVV